MGNNSEDKLLLLENINRLHTTDMGLARISRNIKTETGHAVEYCRDLITDGNCRIYRHGKNWYCETGDIRITVNASSYTIITAHQMKKV